MVFAAFELHMDMLMALRLNGSEVDALLPPANATNASAPGALVISAVLFRRGRHTHLALTCARHGHSMLLCVAPIPAASGGRMPGTASGHTAAALHATLADYLAAGLRVQCCRSTALQAT